MTFHVKHPTSPTITAEWLLARVREEGFGCLAWTGYSQKGQPKANLDGRPRNVRRLVWASAGRKLRKGGELICTCGTENCVALEHLRQVSRKQRMQLHFGGVPRNPAHIIKTTLNRRAVSRFSDEAVRRIRESDTAPKEIAAEVGCTPQYVHLIRNGSSRRDLTGPFVGLGARGG